MSFDRIHRGFSSGSAPTFTEEPSNQSPAEGNNITLEWRYTFGGGSFRQLQVLGKSVVIVYKFFTDKVPYIAPGYRGRLLANVTDTYASITFLRANRTDSTTYNLNLVSRTIEMADSQVEISVECEYNKTNKTIVHIRYIFCYA